MRKILFFSMALIISFILISHLAFSMPPIVDVKIPTSVSGASSPAQGSQTIRATPDQVAVAQGGGSSTPTSTPTYRSGGGSSPRAHRSSSRSSSHSAATESATVVVGNCGPLTLTHAVNGGKISFIGNLSNPKPCKGGDLYLWQSTSSQCFKEGSNNTIADKVENSVYYAGTIGSTPNSDGVVYMPADGTPSIISKFQKLDGTQHVGGFVGEIDSPEAAGKYTYCLGFRGVIKVANGESVPKPTRVYASDVVDVAGPPPKKPIAGILNAENPNYVLKFTDIYYGENFKDTSSLVGIADNEDREFSFIYKTPLQLKLKNIDLSRNLYLGMDFSCEEQRDKLNTVMLQNLQKKSGDAEWNTAAQSWDISPQLLKIWATDYRTAAALFAEGQYAKGTGAVIGTTLGKLAGATIKFFTAGAATTISAFSQQMADLRSEIASGQLSTSQNFPISRETGEVAPPNTEFISKLPSTGMIGTDLILGTAANYNKDYWTILSPEDLQGSIDGTARWQIDSIEGNTIDTMPEGDQHTFYACQFKVNDTTGFLEVRGKSFVKIIFSREGVACNTVQDCLAKIDKKFTEQVFTEQ